MRYGSPKFNIRIFVELSGIYHSVIIKIKLVFRVIIGIKIHTFIKSLMQLDSKVEWLEFNIALNI